ncbi:MAG: right-handed parallel beta-helix repeat-containing protein [bacterium]
MSFQNFRRVRYTAWIALLVFALGAGGGQAHASTAVAKCSKRIAKALKDYSSTVAKTLGGCEVDDLKDEQAFLNCQAEPDVLKDLDKAADKLWREVSKCKTAPLKAVCPLGAKDFDGFVAAAATSLAGPGKIFQGIIEDVFKSPLNPNCSRPAGGVSRDAETCADRLVRIIEDVSDDAQKCLYKCELSNLRSSNREPCLEPETNLPESGGKLAKCLSRAFGDLEEEILHRCTAENGDPNGLLVELGCPFGQAAMQPVVAILWDRLYQAMIDLNLEIFRSDCKSNLNDGDAAALEPARATLSPSGLVVEIHCGQVLGRSFFRGQADERNDTDLDFDSHLDCGDSATGGDGFVIAHSGVSISGRGKWSIEGPRKSSLRDGYGIRIAAGTNDITIANFRSIQRFGVGIGDEFGSRNIEVDETRLRRNVLAGIRLFAPGSHIEGVKADRNNIGFVLFGDNSTLKESRATRSEGPDATGVILGGVDTDGNGHVVRVTSCDIERNEGVGLWAASGPQQVEESDFVANGAAGIVIDGDGGKYESNSVKLNGGAGILLRGSANLLTANRSDENSGAGYFVDAIALDNDLNNNGAGTATDHGNLGYGFEIFGDGTILDTNSAEANSLAGYYIGAATGALDGNFAGDNVGRGFHIAAAGNTPDTNVAENNGAAEFTIVSGNTDGSGNRANGATFIFGSEGVANAE